MIDKNYKEKISFERLENLLENIAHDNTDKRERDLETTLIMGYIAALQKILHPEKLPETASDVEFDLKLMEEKYSGKKEI